MGFMSKEEIVEFEKNSKIVNSGTTKRTCITCSHHDDCADVVFFLQKSGKNECPFWFPSQKTCGVCKYSVHSPEIGFHLYCTVKNPSSRKKVKFEAVGCKTGWELQPELERFG